MKEDQKIVIYQTEDGQTQIDYPTLSYNNRGVIAGGEGVVKFGAEFF